MKKTASASSILKSVAKETSAPKGKNEIPEMHGLGKFADILHKAVLVKKEAEAEEKLAEANILPPVSAEYLALGRAGKFTKSINVPGEETAGVQITFQDRFSGIPIDNETELRALDPKFDEHFEQKRDIALKDSSKETLELLIKKLGKNVSDIFEIRLKDTSDKTIEKLSEKLGSEFSKLFDVTLSLKAREHLDEKLHEIPNKALGFIKQAKGSVKLGVSK